jgi:hypothetical protein
MPLITKGVSRPLSFSMIVKSALRVAGGAGLLLRFFSEIAPLEQAVTQAPQPRHFSSTSAAGLLAAAGPSSCSPPGTIACTLQALKQMPQPLHLPGSMAARKGVLAIP